MREILQDRADRLIRPPAEAVGLDLPPRTAAPADEQPAPPPADTPAAQDLERSTADDPYNNPQAPVRNEGGGGRRGIRQEPEEGSEPVAQGGRVGGSPADGTGEEGGFAPTTTRENLLRDDGF